MARGHGSRPRRLPAVRVVMRYVTTDAETGLLGSARRME
jgi:hypothetical protein